MYVKEDDDEWFSIDDQNQMSQAQSGYSLTFNKDGTLLATPAGKLIKIWKFNNGILSYDKNKYMIKAHELDINTLKFSKCSNLLLSGSDDKTLCIWQGDDNNSFSKVQSIGLNSWPIHAIFNNDDSFIFCGCWNGNLQIFGKVGNQYNKHQTIASHQQQIYSVSLNHSETLLLTLGWDNRIFIYNKDANNKWNQKQEIILNNQGFRASFLDDNQIVYQPKSVETKELYQFEGFGNFEKKNVLFQAIKAGDDKSYFPIKYNKQQRLVAIKHNKYIYIYTKKNDNVFELKKQLQYDDDTFFGDISPDFQYAVVWIKSKKQYQIQKI